MLHFGTLDPADPNLPPRSFAAALEIMKDLHPILLSSAFRSTPSAGSRAPLLYILGLVPRLLRLSITNTSKVNYCQALPALLSYIPDSVEFEGRLRQAEPSAPPPTTTTPPPLISKSDCAVHTTLPAHNIIPHRPPDGRIALLPQQDHPSHRPALNARLHQRATPICLQLLVLVSQGRQPTAASAPAPSQGELAVQHLLKVVRSDASGTVPRDHRERVAHKLNPLSLDEPGSDFEDDALTPRLTTRRRPQ
ncbi:hypothetical protein EDB85DRAFT_2293461 [Lactarius pseudohatsudake]|nr:hypothetical protein EDB85DRAFT_2293461 [Lactarius pseudohatsudake]